MRSSRNPTLDCTPAIVGNIGQRRRVCIRCSQLFLKWGGTQMKSRRPSQSRSALWRATRTCLLEAALHHIIRAGSLTNGESCTSGSSAPVLIMTVDQSLGEVSSFVQAILRTHDGDATDVSRVALASAARRWAGCKHRWRHRCLALHCFVGRSDVCLL